MRIASAGHAVFAATMIALGILGLVNGDFAALWQPVPKGLPVREALLPACLAISVVCGAALFWRRAAALAARALLAWLLLWLVVRVPGMIRTPSVGLWWAACKTGVMAAAAWVLYVRFATDRDRQLLGPAARETGVQIARVLFGFALVFFGWAHFAYLGSTAPLVPGWLPWHVGWSYFTGGAFIAAGVAVLTGVFARLAAALAALQIGLFTLLVWVPRMAFGAVTPFQRGEFAVSCALTAAAWVLADSFRGTPWLAVALGMPKTGRQQAG